MNTITISYIDKNSEEITYLSENVENTEEFEANYEHFTIIENTRPQKRSTKSNFAFNEEEIDFQKPRKKKPKPYHCTLCPTKRIFASKLILNRHLASEHEKTFQKESIMCEICSAVLTSPAYFERHMRLKHYLTSNGFTCDHCGKKFDHKDYLRIHIDRHRKYQTFTCNVCQKSYISVHSFRKHLKSHLDKHICNVCGLVFSKKSTLEGHFLSKHSNEFPYKCDYCTRCFSSRTTKNNHQYIAHKNNKKELKFKCKECNIYFEMKEELRIHSFIHFNGEIKTCTECDQIFKTTRLLNIHMQKHETKKSRQCQNCGEFFTFNTGLAKHIRLNRFICKEEEVDEEKILEIARNQFEEISKGKKAGDGTYDVFEDLIVKDDEEDDTEKEEIIWEEEESTVIEEVDWQHEREVSNAIESIVEETKETRKDRKKNSEETRQKSGRAHLIYTCDYCGEQVKYKKKFIEHIKQHMKRFLCLICNESFKSRNKYIEHSVEVHKMKPTAVEGKFSCETCDKKFDSRSMLEAHKLSHDDSLRSHVCGHCGAAFKTVGNLNRHQATHAAVRNFHCDKCTKTFKTNLALKIHKDSVHAYLKTFVNCSVCKVIVQERNLSQHMKNMHSEEDHAYECSACGKKFKSVYLAQRHYDAIHEPKDRGVCYACDHCEAIRISFEIMFPI